MFGHCVVERICWSWCICKVLHSFSVKTLWIFWLKRQEGNIFLSTFSDWEIGNVHERGKFAIKIASGIKLLPRSIQGLVAVL